jgi:hypothetical protein
VGRLDQVSESEVGERHDADFSNAIEDQVGGAGKPAGSQLNRDK